MTKALVVIGNSLSMHGKVVVTIELGVWIDGSLDGLPVDRGQDRGRGRRRGGRVGGRGQCPHASLQDARQLLIGCWQPWPGWLTTSLEKESERQGGQCCDHKQSFKAN